MNRPRSLHLLCALGASVIAGCAVGPDYSRPTVTTPTGWKERADQAGTEKPPVLPTKWWEIFADGDLDQLEAKAIAANQDLQRALARVSEARALARSSAAE